MFSLILNACLCLHDHSLSLSPLSTYVGFIHELFFVLSCCLVFECVDTVSVPMVGLDWTRLDSTLIVFVSTMVCIPPKKKTRSRHDPSTVGLVCVNSIVQYVRCMYKISRVFFVLVVLLVSLSHRIISYRIVSYAAHPHYYYLRVDETISKREDDEFLE